MAYYFRRKYPRVRRLGLKGGIEQQRGSLSLPAIRNIIKTNRTNAPQNCGFISMILVLLSLSLLLVFTSSTRAEDIWRVNIDIA